MGDAVADITPLAKYGNPNPTEGEDAYARNCYHPCLIVVALQHKSHCLTDVRT